MKYMIIISHNQQAMDSWSQMSEVERAAGYQAHQALHDDLNDSGQMVVAEVLADVSQAKRVLVDSGGTTVADGPAGDAGSHLAGFYLVDCDSMERAVEWAARIPEAALGLVEVRPVR
jgi:hypothetical protein